MADNIKIWADRIDTQKNAESDIIVDTISVASRKNTWRDIIAFFLSLIQNIWDKSELDFEEKVATRPFRTIEELRQIAITWQYGKKPVFLGDRFGYVASDSSLEIADECCVIAIDSVGSQRGLIVHPGKYDANGDLQPLSTLEQSDFELYFESMKSFGRRIDYVSTAIGNLILTIEIFYDPTKFNSDGSKFSDSSVFPVLDAIEDYMDNYVNKTGYINESELKRRLYIIDGVGDLIYTKHRWDGSGGTTYTDLTGFGSIDINKLVQYNKAGTPEITYTVLT